MGRKERPFPEALCWFDEQCCFGYVVFPFEIFAHRAPMFTLTKFPFPFKEYIAFGNVPFIHKLKLLFRFDHPKLVQSIDKIKYLPW